MDLNFWIGVSMMVSQKWWKKEIGKMKVIERNGKGKKKKGEKEEI